MPFPFCFLAADDTLIVFHGPVDFVYLDTQYSQQVFFIWNDDDWASACPDWLKLTVVDNMPSQSNTKITTRNPHTAWVASRLLKTCTVTYTTVNKSAEQIAQEAAAADQALFLAVQDAVQAHLDSKARERNYSGILSACTYATSTVPKYAAEGQYCVSYRDRAYETCYQLLSEVQTGKRPRMTPAQVVAELPVFTWPV